MKRSATTASLRRLREQRGSLDYASEKTGLNKGQISKYERGVLIPTIRPATKIGNFLGISAERVQQLALEAHELLQDN